MMDTSVSEKMKIEAKVLGYTEGEYAKYLLSLIEDIKKAYAKNRPSDEEREVARCGYKKWGEYGWAVFGNLGSLGLAGSFEDANSKALSFFDDEYLQAVIGELINIRSEKGMKLHKCLNRQLYEYGTMLGFAYIDYEIITHDLIGEAKQRRATGEKGMQNIVSWLRDNKDYDGLGWLSNLHACIEILFEDGKDFRGPMKIVNRNYLLHGMAPRDIEKEDFIRVLLCYHSVSNFMDIVCEK